MPRPRKLMDASVRMALERARVAWTVKGATTLGEMWRTRIAPVLTPTLRALATYSSPLAEMTEARTVRANTGMFTMPMALRRSANGSEEPVGPWPTANRPQMVSSLSAKATSLPTVVSGSASPAKRG